MTLTAEPAAPAAAAVSSWARGSGAIVEARWARWLIGGTALGFLGVFLVIPLAVVFTEALRKGVEAYFASLSEPAALSALKLTLLVAAIVVPCSAVFGLAAAWAIAKFRFVGRSVLLTLIDLPLAVSPVIAGLAYVLLLGLQGWLGAWLADHNLRVIFALPGVILVSLFVTLPFVARELIALMQEQGEEQEQAALLLGASGWQIFRRVTLPNCKWALLYGLILSNARSMGEFGAVSVVSGHIRGKTNTLPLHVEILYNEYQFAAAFAVASLLTLLAVLTLTAKSVLEYQSHRRLRGALDPAAHGESES